jgi:hypothetical protein
MIKASPKGSTLFSLVMAILLLSAALGAVIYFMAAADRPRWYHYTLIVLILAVLIPVLIKALYNLKTLTLKGGKLEVNYLAGLRQKVYSMDQLMEWRELIIKTQAEPFKQISLRFPAGSVSLSKQEHNGYAEMVAYLNKRHPRLKVHEEA